MLPLLKSFFLPIALISSNILNNLLIFHVYLPPSTPSQEHTLHEDEDFCLFYSLMYPRHMSSKIFIEWMEKQGLQSNRHTLMKVLSSNPGGPFYCSIKLSFFSTLPRAFMLPSTCTNSPPLEPHPCMFWGYLTHSLCLSLHHSRRAREPPPRTRP